MTIDTISTNQFQNRKGQPADGPCAERVSRDVEILYPLAYMDAESAIDIALRKKSLLRLTGDHSGEKVSVEAGVIWITQSGSPEDFFLSAGESFEITQKGAILVEGVARTCLKITRTQSSFNFGRTLGNTVHHILSILPERIA